MIGELTNETILSAYKSTSKFFSEPIKNPLGIEIVDKMKKNNLKYFEDFEKIEKNNKLSFSNIKHVLDS